MNLNSSYLMGYKKLAPFTMHFEAVWQELELPLECICDPVHLSDILAEPVFFERPRGNIPKLTEGLSRETECCASLHESTNSFLN